jgi:hypothetical protein
LGGEIDMQAEFRLDLAAKKLTCSATVDSFPAFEAYATINDGAGVAIFLQPPPAGNTVMSLPGDATTKIAPISLVDLGNGVFGRPAARLMPPSTSGRRQTTKLARPR